MSDQSSIKAIKLWENFHPEKEEKFWQKYEKLIQREKNALGKRLQAEPTMVSNEEVKTLIFYPKRQAFFHKLMAFQKKHFLFTSLPKNLGIGLIIAIGATLSGLFWTGVPFLYATFVLTPIYYQLKTFGPLKHIAIVNGCLAFCEFEKGMTPYVFINSIYSLKLVFRPVYKCFMLRVHTTTGVIDYEYKLGKDVHQKFVQYFKERSIPFDDRSYNK